MLRGVLVMLLAIPAEAFLCPARLCVARTVSPLRLAKEDTGLFRLPDGDSGGDGEVGVQVSPRDERARVLDILLAAFDYLQDFEVRDMTERIYEGTTADHVNCQTNLSRLASRIATLQLEADRGEALPFGTMEYLQDNYRSALSEVRMYGKDAEWFLPGGGLVPREERGFKMPPWPWQR